MDTKTIRILHLEDNPHDAELIARALGESLSFSITRVAAKTDFLAMLGEGGWDFILSDKDMPGFDGLEALTIVRGRRLDVPFILVTGVTDADTIIEAFRRGLTDYVLKSKTTTELLPAMKRALEKSKPVAREMLPICMYCKNIRVNEEESAPWLPIEKRLKDYFRFSHGICPMCNEKHVKPMLEVLKNQPPPRQ